MTPSGPLEVLYAQWIEVTLSLRFLMWGCYAGTVRLSHNNKIIALFHSEQKLQEINFHYNYVHFVSFK